MEAFVVGSVEANLYIFGLVFTAGVMMIIVLASFITAFMLVRNRYKTNKKNKRLKRFKIIKGEKKETWFHE